MLPSLVLCLHFDENSRIFFERQRRKFYPAYCNSVDAHCTLLHKVPAEHPGLDILHADMSRVASFDVKVNDLVLYPNGLAYSIDSSLLSQLHENLQKIFSGSLISKDRKPLSAHVTIQNRVTAHKAHTLYRELLETFEPFSARAEGINTYVYHRHRWQLDTTILFRG